MIRLEMGVVQRVDYVNYKGEARERLICPAKLYYGATEYHPEEQWLLEAFDLDKREPRTFALNDMRPIDWKARK